MDKKATRKKMIEPINPNWNETPGNENEYPFEPDGTVINNILNYSKALSIRKSKSGKQFELVLN